MSGDPFPKSAQLARGERRYRRKVASPKQWQAIIAAKQGPCRICRAGARHAEMHHLVTRGSEFGDDVPDNLVPLCHWCHVLVTYGAPYYRRKLDQSLTDDERAYVAAKRGR